MLRSILVLAAIATCPAIAGADTTWHGGLNIRADLGAHPIRTPIGVEVNCVDTTLVLDPMFWTDGQHDVDLLVTWSPGTSGYGVLGGWRTTAIGLGDGHQFQQKLVLGVSAPLPKFASWVRARWAFELSTVVVKHGGGLPSEWISFASGRDFIDLLNFGMFVSFEYAR